MYNCGVPTCGRGGSQASIYTDAFSCAQSNQQTCQPVLVPVTIETLVSTPAKGFTGTLYIYMYIYVHKTGVHHYKLRLRFASGMCKFQSAFYLKVCTHQADFELLPPHLNLSSPL